MIICVDCKAEYPDNTELKSCKFCLAALQVRGSKKVYVDPHVNFLAECGWSEEDLKQFEVKE